jgi:hypothetical protein
VKEADEASDTESDSADNDSEAEGDRGEPAMTEMQQACLSFCIELSNQTVHNREYDMALICGLAALGFLLSELPYSDVTSEVFLRNIVKLPEGC